MQSYTAFLHGENFTIISPLADLDLLAYFKGKYEDFNSRSRDFTPAHLLYGAGCLAGALRFLHEGLQPFGPSERIYCAHLDLKPENILVQWSRNPSEPAGRWKVHDFGTAKIKSRSQNSAGSTRLVAPGDFISQFSYTQATRTPGPFQAPEVQDSTDRVVGTESDVWSLGCICACTLAFARGGPTAVTQLYTSLEHESDNDYFYVKREGRFALKESVKAYLESLASGSGGRTWVRQTLNLIYDTLVEDPRVRPTANDLQMTLRSIFNGTEVSLTGKCPWAPRAVRPRPASPPPPGPAATSHPPQPVAPVNDTEPGPLEQQQFTVILRAPTGLQYHAAPVQDQGQPGLEVVQTPTATTPTMMSDFESLHHRPYPTVSRSSSTSTRPVSLTDDITFFRVSTPGDTFKSIICPDACHAAFISKKQVAITRIMDQGWSNQARVKPLTSSSLCVSTKDSSGPFEWDDGCMAGRYIVLRAKRVKGEERKVWQPIPQSNLQLNKMLRSTDTNAMTAHVLG
jgi:serine/threonine protein kinase